MAKYSFTNKAVEDLSSIWNYTYERWSENQADKYYEMLIDFCQQLADKPILGKSYNQIAEHLLGFRAGKHIIFYRVISKTGIEVIRILHERMDLKSRITE
jgi:toxin ParE1/3/4